ncbi:MAG: AraC family transcriptional regulator [Sandaracinaceae bacterium]|nr:AraC family transcriptional regulator [Sandaracinaceae bacterium]
MEGDHHVVWLMPYQRLVEAVVPDARQRRALFERAGLTELQLGDREARVPATHRDALVEGLAEVLADPDIGLTLGLTVPRGLAGTLDLAMRSAPDLGCALVTAARYWIVLGDVAGAELARRPDEIGLELTYPASHIRGRCHAAELSISWVLRVLRDLVGRNVIPSRVTFQSSAGPSLDAYRAWFGVTPRFEASCHGLYFRAEDAHAAGVQPDAALNDVLEHHLGRLVASVPARNEPTRDRVARVLTRELPSGEVTMELVAQRLGQSTRTLQRRLQAEGTTWAELLDETRASLASAHLADDRLALGEIAFLLGYASPAAFTRAYRRWTGRTPSEARSAGS